MRDQVILDCKSIFDAHPNLEVNILNGSSYDDWCLDLLEQVTISQSEYFLLLPEDHEFISTAPVLDQTLKNIFENRVDYVPLSFYPHYEVFVKLLSTKKSHLMNQKYINYWDIHKNDILSIPIKQRNYILNLIGVYRRDLLVKVLCSNKPLLKRFAKETPFNFEQPPSQFWFLPIRWGYPTDELFACVDDDHGIPGYSLFSRNGFAKGEKRVVEHHDAYLNYEYRVYKLFKSIFRVDLFLLFRITKYNFDFYKSFRKRNKIIKKLFRV